MVRDGGFGAGFEFDPAEGARSHSLIDTRSQVMRAEPPILKRR